MLVLAADNCFSGGSCPCEIVYLHAATKPFHAAFTHSASIKMRPSPTVWVKSTVEMQQTCCKQSLASMSAIVIAEPGPFALRLLRISYPNAFPKAPSGSTSHAHLICILLILLISYVQACSNNRHNLRLGLCPGSSGGRCLYVSGVPGTGKTATVLETMRSLRRKAEARQLPAFQFVEINSLRLPSPQHAYTHLYEVGGLESRFG